METTPSESGPNRSRDLSFEKEPPLPAPHGTRQLNRGNSRMIMSLDMSRKEEMLKAADPDRAPWLISILAAYEKQKESINVCSLACPPSPRTHPPPSRAAPAPPSRPHRCGVLLLLRWHTVVTRRWPACRCSKSHWRSRRNRWRS